MEALASVPHLHLILAAIVYVCIIGGIGLIMFVPFFPGLAMVLAGVLVYVGVESLLAKSLAGIDPFSLGLFVVLGIIGLTSSLWTEKLGLRFSYMSQEVMWGAIIGSLLGTFLFGMLGMLLGLIIGCMAMEMRRGRKPLDSLQAGASALMSMLGPRGFQLIMALVLANVALDRVVGL